jgi:hypothetical protein
VLPEDHVSVHPATEGQSARVQARSRHRTIGPRDRCRRRGRSFREDGHEPGCRLVGVPASALEGMGIECAPFKRQEDRTRPGAGGDGIVEKTEKGRSTSERFWLPACLGVKAQHGDQLDFGRTPTVPATKCGVLAHRPARRGCRGRPEAVGGREPVSRRRQDWGRTVQRDRAAVCAQEQGLGHFSVGTDGFIVTRPLIWMDQECDDLIGSATRS